MKRAILVNGVPASGKSTVAAAVTQHLMTQGLAPVPLALDTIKEGLYAHLGTGDREHNRLLGRASYQSLFSSVAAFPATLVPVIDAWFGFQPEQVLHDHLKRAAIEQVIEIWCDVAPATAAARYRARADQRHPGHLPASYADELFDLTKSAKPMAIGPLVRINTEKPISIEDLKSIASLLQR